MQRGRTAVDPPPETAEARRRYFFTAFSSPAILRTFASKVTWRLPWSVKNSDSAASAAIYPVLDAVVPTCLPSATEASQTFAQLTFATLPVAEKSVWIWLSECPILRIR